MHRPVFLMIVWALFTGKVFGQGTNTNACHLTPAQFPTVRGLRLGMTPDQVLNLLPPDPDKGDLARQAHSPNTYDVTSLEYVPNKHGNPPEFMGVARIFMFFYRGQLADFGVDYTPPHEGGVVWRDLNEFVTKVAGALQLPGPDAWVIGKQGDRVLKCEGLQVQASVGVIRISVDPTWVDDVDARRKADEDEKRRTFRP
jgi:hypothetical protein